MSKASARSLGLILNNDTIIGGKANVVVDGKGNYFVNDASGADRYGTQKPLIDTGNVDANGNKIFAEVSTDNSKRNYVSVVSNYVRQPDGTFTYAGIDSTDYTHVEGFNPIKSLVIAGLAGGLGAAAGALSGLSGAAGNALTGAVAGASGAALSGSNILKGALLGGLGGFSVGEIQAAAKVAGGYDNLFSQVGGGDLSAFTGPANAGIKLTTDAAGNIIDAATGKAFTGTGIPNLNVNTVLGSGGAGVNLLTGAGNVIGTGLLGEAAGGGNLGNLIATSGNAGGVTAGDILSANMGGVEDIANAVDLNPITNVPGGSPGINLSINGKAKTLSLNAKGDIIDNATGLPFSEPGIKLGLDAAGNIIDATTGLPFTGPGINVVNPTTGTYVDPTTLIPFIQDPNTSTTTTPGDKVTPGDDKTITETIKDVVKPILPVLPFVPLIPPIIDALTPKTPKPTTYTAPLINNVVMPTNQVPNLVQNYNNLFNRQGVGAGQYLGYDYLNNINVPPELMGLLGTSAQANPTSFTMPSMIAKPA
jgi:hypothetical protein